MSQNKTVLGPNQTLWVEALKSGRFAKGKGQLMGEPPSTRNPVYCCLGCACVLYNEAHPDAKVDIIGFYLSERKGLNVVKDWLGLKTENAAWVDVNPKASNTQESLAYVNDKSNTFEPVIEAIMAHADTLFTEPK